jgi:hypothetical protein
MKKLFLIFLFLMFFIPDSFCSGKRNAYTFHFVSDRMMQVGEELTYEVSYSLLKLGKVILQIKDRKKSNGKYYYTTIAFIDSYPGIPFVDLHQIYESRIAPEMHSEYFKGLARYEDHTNLTEYRFDYDKSLIRVKRGKVYPPEIWADSVTSADQYYQDGLSIFYYARANFGENKTINIPCFVNEEKVYTKINYYTDVTDVSIDAVKYKISCRRLDGETDFISVFGLTGYFQGWFTNDEASIPVIAKMRVIIGNITLELKEWKREGWNPPRYLSMKN